MSKIKEAVIKEIAREIAKGNTCYLQRSNKKITTIHHSIQDVKLIATQEKTQAELERKIGRHIKIVKLSTDEQLVIMKDFVEELSDRSARREVSNALNRKNPIRNFNQVMEGNLDLNSHWRSFNSKEYQRWVSNFIADAYHYTRDQLI